MTNKQRFNRNVAKPSTNHQQSEAIDNSLTGSNGNHKLEDNKSAIITNDATNDNSISNNITNETNTSTIPNEESSTTTTPTTETKKKRRYFKRNTESSSSEVNKNINNESIMQNNNKLENNDTLSSTNSNIEEQSKSANDSILNTPNKKEGALDVSFSSTGQPSPYVTTTNGRRKGKTNKTNGKSKILEEEITPKKSETSHKDLVSDSKNEEDKDPELITRIIARRKQTKPKEQMTTSSINGNDFNQVVDNENKILTNGDQMDMESSEEMEFDSEEDEGDVKTKKRKINRRAVQSKEEKKPLTTKKRKSKGYDIVDETQKVKTKVETKQDTNMKSTKKLKQETSKPSVEDNEVNNSNVTNTVNTSNNTPVRSKVTTTAKSPTVKVENVQNIENTSIGKGLESENTTTRRKRKEENSNKTLKSTPQTEERKTIVLKSPPITEKPKSDNINLDDSVKEQNIEKINSETMLTSTQNPTSPTPIRELSKIPKKKSSTQEEQPPNTSQSSQIPSTLHVSSIPPQQDNNLIKNNTGIVDSDLNSHHSHSRGFQDPPPPSHSNSTHHHDYNHHNQFSQSNDPHHYNSRHYNHYGHKGQYHYNDVPPHGTYRGSYNNRYNNTRYNNRGYYYNNEEDRKEARKERENEEITNDQYESYSEMLNFVDGMGIDQYGSEFYYILKRQQRQQLQAKLAKQQQNVSTTPHSLPSPLLIDTPEDREKQEKIKRIVDLQLRKCVETKLFVITEENLKQFSERIVSKIFPRETLTNLQSNEGREAIEKYVVKYCEEKCTEKKE
ncbi:hypothetical protein ABK040_009167 [Willaertia magna]